MKYLFAGCASLAELNLDSFDTSAVRDMQHMFDGCASLGALNVSRFDTSAVTNMDSMFRNTGNISKLDVSSFNTASVTNMNGMFAGTGMETLNLSAFDTSAVTTMNGMFQSSALVTLDLTDGEDSKWNTAKVTDMTSMFRNCAALTTVNVHYGTFNTDAVTGSADMFTSSTKLTGGRGTAYDPAHIDKEYARVDLGTRQPGYFTDPALLFVTFLANDDAEDPATGTMEEQPFIKGKADTLDPNAFVREGYDYLGWNTAPDGSGSERGKKVDRRLRNGI